MDDSKIIKKKDSQRIVFDYEPKEFPLIISDSATGFVSEQDASSSDFKISEIVAEQAGIAKLAKQNLEKKVEEEALKRLKNIEEKAYKEAYDVGLIEGADKAFQERKVDIENGLQRLNEFLEAFENIKKKIITGK